MLSAPGNRPFEVTGEQPEHASYDWVVPPEFYAYCGDRPIEAGRPKIPGRDYERWLADTCR